MYMGATQGMGADDAKEQEMSYMYIHVHVSCSLGSLKRHLNHVYSSIKLNILEAKGCIYAA